MKVNVLEENQTKKNEINVYGNIVKEYEKDMG